MIDYECEQALSKLLRYCRSESWIGYDPYDGLNASLADSFLFRTSFSRTLLTQLVKRSPINLRPILGINKEFNPKGVALAARAVMLLADRSNCQIPFGIEAPSEYSADGLEADFTFLMSRLASLRSGNYAEACWGYNFDWQSRAFFAPRGTPNVVCTVFAAHALLDWYERTESETVLQMAMSSCRFLLDRINRTRGVEDHCFSYTPLDRSQIHNVNLLAAELLARTFTKTGIEEYREAAEQAARFTLARQRSDGSWRYGEARTQTWIDGFHTGFVLVSLKHLIEKLNEKGWKAALEAGYGYYEKRFFLADGTPGYYHDRLNPLDVHSAAQGVITFVEMTDLMPNAKAMAGRVVKWAIDTLQDPAGFFYFQRHRFWTNKISYMRWAQAWMLYALSLYISRSRMTQNV
jgi:rhamnogalacturonyl hydrolase YesR